MIEIKCKHCEENVMMTSMPTSDIELNEFIGVGLWLYMHLQLKHPDIFEKAFTKEIIKDTEELIKEVKKLYGAVFFEI